MTKRTDIILPTGDRRRCYVEQNGDTITVMLAGRPLTAAEMAAQGMTIAIGDTTLKDALEAAGYPVAASPYTNISLHIPVALLDALRSSAAARRATLNNEILTACEAHVNKGGAQ